MVWQRTRVQNKNLSTDKVKPECQLDQQTKSLTGHIDDKSSAYYVWQNKTDEKNFGLTGLVKCYGGNPKVGNC